MFKETPEGLVFTVKVVPQSRKNEIVGWHEEILKIKIAATPEKGQANKALIQFLAKTLNISQNEIEILRGKTSQIKTIILRNKRISDISIY